VGDRHTKKGGKKRHHKPQGSKKCGSRGGFTRTGVEQEEGSGRKGPGEQRRAAKARAHSSREMMSGRRDPRQASWALQDNRSPPARIELISELRRGAPRFGVSSRGHREVSHPKIGVPEI